MVWILLATAAQLINAVVAILDKYIVSDKNGIPKPFVYGFYSCIVSGAWVIIYAAGLLPFSIPAVPMLSEVQTPTLVVIAFSFLAAYTLFLALVSLYTALQKADASDVMPVVGAVSAISSFGLAYLFLEGDIVANFAWGIVFLAIGTFIISRMRFSRAVAWSALHAGIFFAIHYVAMKALFSVTNFSDGFFWSRVTLVMFALTLLLVPSYYRKITEQTKATSGRTGLLVMGNKLLAGIAAIMILKATDLGDVAVVQALDGLKFVFILIIGLMIGHKLPSTCGENDGDCRRREIIQKVLAVMVISFGYILLFV